MLSLPCVRAGNVFGVSLGIAGADVENNIGVLKTATLSSTLSCPSFGSVGDDVMPILRVAVEPMDPGQLPQLLKGLHLLNQSDPAVRISITSTGEHLIETAGELHLERCLRDLKERFAKGVEVSVGEALVPYRESAAMVAGGSVESAVRACGVGTERVEEGGETGVVSMWTPNRLCKITIRAVPMPSKVTNWLYEREGKIRSVAGDAIGINSFKEEFAEVIREFENEGQVWERVKEKLWDFGPGRSGCNLLVDFVEGGRFGWGTNANANATVKDQDGSTARIKFSDVQASINSGFQLATQSGPLCNEPMMGMCFVIEGVEFDVDDDTDALQLGLLSGQIISTVKEACRLSFLQWSTRLMVAMYSCELQAPSDVLGKVYAVISKRKGRILSEEMRDNTTFFTIKSLIPVVESFGFSEDLWKKTSGSATPQLLFHGFEILDIDPFWVPTTEEELEDLGEHADRENVARRYLDSVRKRKGLFVEKKVVEHAEKQKTAKQK